MVIDDAAARQQARMSVRADQFSNLRSTSILPVAEKHGQDARATPIAVTRFEQLIGPTGVCRRQCHLIHIPLLARHCRHDRQTTRSFAHFPNGQILPRMSCEAFVDVAIVGTVPFDAPRIAEMSAAAAAVSYPRRSCGKIGRMFVCPPRLSVFSVFPPIS